MKKKATYIFEHIDDSFLLMITMMGWRWLLCLGLVVLYGHLKDAWLEWLCFA